MLFHCSHIFWIGDLNYRLVDNPPRSEFEVTNYSDIIKRDQLYQEMQRRRVFLGYREGEINFRPTYKYDPGTDDWDSRLEPNILIKDENIVRIWRRRDKNVGMKIFATKHCIT